MTLAPDVSAPTVRTSSDPSVPGAPDRPAPRIVAAPRPGRWIAAVVVAVLLAMAVHAAVTNDNPQWDLVWLFLPTRHVVSGLYLTLWLTAVVTVLGLLIGARTGRHAPVRQPRPAGRQLDLRVVVPLRPAAGAVAVLVLRRGALPAVVARHPVRARVRVGGRPLVHQPDRGGRHRTDVARGSVRRRDHPRGIASVDAGQTEAAKSLGPSKARTYRRIVLPQAMRAIVPAAGNLLIGTLKGTAVVSVIAVSDLLLSVQLIYNRSVGCASPSPARSCSTASTSTSSPAV